MISAFETNFCGKAQTDGDIDADLLFYLAKYDALVQIAEYWVSRKTEWPATWNAVESFNATIEGIDSGIEEAVEYGIDKYEAVKNYITVEKSAVDTEINNAATVTP